jgi:hypothetical protein
MKEPRKEPMAEDRDRYSWTLSVVFIEKPDDKVAIKSHGQYMLLVRQSFGGAESD